MARLRNWVKGLTELWLIGMGTGHPGHVTLEGMEALRDANSLLIPRKGSGKEDLAHLRHAIVAASETQARVLEFDMPVRDEAKPYEERVSLWHDEIARRWEAAMPSGKEHGPVALLVWGDPGLYDSTLRIAERLSPKPRIRIVPGISTLQALTAAHAMPFNTVNGNVTVTTGRRLRDQGWPSGAETLSVMLGGKCSFQTLDPTGLYIWWGGFLGMPEQGLESGALSEVGPRIIETRKAARERHGWIMDAYLLRRTML